MGKPFDKTIADLVTNARAMAKDLSDLKRRINRLSSQSGGGLYLPFANYEVVAAGITTTRTVFIATVPRALLVRSWTQAWFVNAAQTTAAHWTLSIQSQSLGVIASFVTTGGAVNTWNKFQVLDLTTQVPTTDRYMLVQAAVTGAAGALYLAHPAAYVI